jgi:predicted lipoprotein with Yx(FWY)xxD motif
MKKLTIPAAVASLALLLAACGGSAKSPSSPASPAKTSTASAVLKDASGMALYSPEGETTSNVRCTGACAAIWKPLRPGSVTLAGSKVIQRPDGTKQLAVAGKPLYTFVQDTPGQVTGNGVSDAFGPNQFTWHAVQKGGVAASTSKPASTPGYSNGY